MREAASTTRESTAVGRDANLPSSGLAIWHIDEDGCNNHHQMTADHHFECSLEQADGRYDLERVDGYGNRGDAYDLFSSCTSSGFGSATSPDSRWWDGSLSGLEIHSLGTAGEEIEFEIG